MENFSAISRHQFKKKLGKRSERSDFIMSFLKVKSICGDDIMNLADFLATCVELLIKSISNIAIFE